MDSIPESVNLLDYCGFYADDDLMRKEIAELIENPDRREDRDVRLLKRETYAVNLKEILYRRT